MKTCFLILVEDKNLAKTIVSLEENSVRPDKYVLLLNKATSEENGNIAKSLSGSCCGKEAQNYTSGEYDISVKDNFLVTKITDKARAIDYLTSNILDDIDIVFTATSGTVFDSKYIEKVLTQFEDENVGLVYSDYFSDGVTSYLQYIQPMLTAPINIKEVAVRRSTLLVRQFKNKAFDFAMDVFTGAIIRHIPEELYAT